jgi:hypothetical protein
MKPTVMSGIGVRGDKDMEGSSGIANQIFFGNASPRAGGWFSWYWLVAVLVKEPDDRLDGESSNDRSGSSEGDGLHGIPVIDRPRLRVATEAEEGSAIVGEPVQSDDDSRVNGVNEKERFAEFTTLEEARISFGSPEGARCEGPKLPIGLLGGWYSF